MKKDSAMQVYPTYSAPSEKVSEKAVKKKHSNGRAGG